MAQVIAVTGGKGGTGKSTVAISIAAELAGKHRVLLVDADVECPNDHLILRTRQHKKKDIYQMIPKIDNKLCTRCGSCVKVCSSNALVQIQDKPPMLFPAQCNGCNACLLACKTKAIKSSEKRIGKIMFGQKQFDLMSGFMDIGHEEPTPIVKELKNHADGIRDKYDYIIVDTAPGTHCNVIAALKGVNQGVAVTEPTPLGAHDLGLILALLDELGIGGGIVINKSDVGDNTQIKKIVKKHKSQIIAEIPYRDSIVRSYSKGLVHKEEIILKIAQKVIAWLKKKLKLQAQ